MMIRRRARGIKLSQSTGSKQRGKVEDQGWYRRGTSLSPLTSSAFSSITWVAGAESTDWKSMSRVFTKSFTVCGARPVDIISTTDQTCQHDTRVCRQSAYHHRAPESRANGS